MRCASMGITTAADCVHHKVPIESASSDVEMQRLAYSESNLEALCSECHNIRHVEMQSKKRENVVARRQKRNEEFEKKFLI